MRARTFKKAAVAVPTKTRIRKGDKVMAIAGDNKGRSGEVLSVGNGKAIVQGLNVRKKHVKKTQNNAQGGILSLEAPIQLSNLMVCVSDNQPKKLKLRVNDSGERELYYKNNGESVTYRTLKTNHSNKK